MWKEAEDFLVKDKYTGPLIKKYGPCKIRPSKKKNYFNDLVYAIVGQQLSGAAALTIFNRLKEKLSGEVVPQGVLRRQDKTLRNCGLSLAKVSYVKDLARKVNDREVEIYKMDKLSDEKIIEELVVVKGIGRWTANMFLMFSLARQDVFPVDDLGIRKGVRKLTGRDLESNKLEKFALRWKPFRTVAAWYVWRGLENT